jgi:O-succinylhomoserine sulfhydrylase
MALLASGDHVVCSRSVFGTTTTLLQKYLAKFGVEVTFVAPTDYAAWSAAITPATRALFIETPSNPLCEVLDIERLAILAHANHSLLIVDNCFCTPALQKPLEMGADIVTHSATKYLDGQGRCVGGVVVGGREHMAEVLGFLRSCGPTMSPFNAWVFLKGLETLRLRMDAHSDSALQLALWLEQQSQVERVYYAGLPSHPGHALARRQQRGFGGVLSFQVHGARAEAWRLIDATRLLSITANLGDAKSTIVHPATTTHGRLSDQQREESGIGQNLIRISVGLEDIQDIQQDLARGLAALGTI